MTLDISVLLDFNYRKETTVILLFYYYTCCLYTYIYIQTKKFCISSFVESLELNNYFICFYSVNFNVI